MNDKKKNMFPTQPSLVGKKVFLRPATADDVINFQYWRIKSEPQTMSCHPLLFSTASEASEAFKKKEKTINEQTFAIIIQEEKTLVGKVAYFNFNLLNRSAELGVMIDPDQYKNGYAADALKILIKYLFRYLGLNKVYAQTSEENKGGIKLLESLNFHKDGTLRGHYYLNGHFKDGLIYSFMSYELDW